MRRFRVVNSNVLSTDGVEFTADDNATDEEVAKEAFDAISERVDFGWEEIAPEQP